MTFKQSLIIAIVTGCFTLLAAYVKNISESQNIIINSGNATAINNGSGNATSNSIATVTQIDNRTYNSANSQQVSYIEKDMQNMMLRLNKNIKNRQLQLEKSMKELNKQLEDLH